MKRMLLLAFLLTIVGFFASSVCAAPYASFNLGIGYVDDVEVSAGEERLEMSFDPGYGITAALGNSYPNIDGADVRAELEFSYLKSDLDKVTLVGVGSADLGGEGTIKSLMLNGYIDFMPNQSIQPFIGAGLGYSNAELDILGISGDDDLFAGQLMGGASFSLTEQLICDLQYRFFMTDDLDFGDGVDADSIRTHNLMLGLRYGF